MKELKVYCKHRFESGKHYLVTVDLGIDEWQESGTEYLQEIEVPEIDKLRFHANAIPIINLAVAVWLFDGDLVCKPIGDSEEIQEAFDLIISVQIVETEPIVSEVIWLTLKLYDNTTVKIKSSADMSKCCTYAPSNTNITIEDITFKKSDVISAEFGNYWDSKPEVNAIYPYEELRDFLTNFSNLVSLSPIPDKIRSLSSSFLSGCISFNQIITFPVPVVGERFQIGNDFLSGCTSFNKPLQFPENVHMHLMGFMFNCNSFTGPLVVPLNFPVYIQNTIEDIQAANIDRDTPPEWITNSILSTTDSNASMYVNGVDIKISDEYDFVFINNFKSGLIPLLPNLHTGIYRKLNGLD